SHQTTATLQIVGSGALTGAYSNPTGPQNLTLVGTIDWAHWGLTGPASFDHKANVTPLISNFTAVGNGTPNNLGDSAVGYTWTDGTPDVNATNSTTGVFVAGQGNGFPIPAPADTTPRILYVYLGAWQAQGTITAHMSDGSVPDYVDSSVNSPLASTVGLYTFNYAAGSNGQTLSITYTLTGGGGNVTLFSSALTAPVPDFTISSTPP